MTQGSSCLATLGFGTESRLDFGSIEVGIIKTGSFNFHERALLAPGLR
jgi:hypothetical protein